MNALVFANYFAAQTSGAILAIGTLTNYKKLKKFAGGIFLGLRKYDHISKGLRSLNWLSTKDRLKLNYATTVFKCIYNLAPDNLANKFRLHSCVHDRQTGSASTLDIPFCRLSTG